MRLLFRSLRLLLRLFLFPLALLRYWRRAPQAAWLSLELDGAVDDLVKAPRFWERFRKRPLSLYALGEALQAAGGDPRIAGLVVTVRSFQGGMASAAALRAVLKTFRARGKQLVVHLPFGADTREMYLATSAARVLVGPQSTVAPLGFAARARYLKGAFAKAGVEPMVLSRGAYKSAGELLVRDAMSEPQREQTGRILEQLHGALLDALAERPGIDRARAQELVDGGPYSGAAAVAVGLADGVAYDDEVAAGLGEKEEPKLVALGRYFAAHRALRLPDVLPRAAIGVVRVHGAIASGSPTLFARGGAEEQVVSAVRAARRTRRIKAVVLHINSPGGSALASDRIHHELEQLAKEKPVVAYFADVAASGGYYIAAAAHQIVARPETITGSIGVVAARFTAEALLEKLGVRSDGLQTGARAHLVDPLAPLRDGDRQALERELDSVYQAFLEVVARGRRRPIEEVRAVAEGRVWTGHDARERGLVDELGDFQVALGAARARLGPKAQKLEPVLVAGGRHAGAPLDPPKTKEGAAAWLLGLLDERAALVVDRRQRVQLFCDLAAALAAGP